VIEGWLDRVERVRFWCAFQITRPADNVLIAQCRQMLALIEMPEGKLLRLPEQWEKYQNDNSAEVERERGTPISDKESIQ
jgi:acyl-CoA thioesterase FadM